MYWYCAFKGYMIVCCANSKERALNALVKYTRETKGNLLYDEAIIRKEAKVNRIDMVDDIGYLSELQNMENNLNKMKREFDERINAETNKHNKMRDALRFLIEATGIIDNYREDW